MGGASGREWEELVEGSELVEESWVQLLFGPRGGGGGRGGRATRQNNLESGWGTKDKGHLNIEQRDTGG